MSSMVGVQGGGNLAEQVKIVSVLVPAVISASAGTLTVDRLNYNSALFSLLAGAVGSSGIFSIKLQHSDTDSDGAFVDVDTADKGWGALTAANITATDQLRQVSVDCRELKRYIRLYLTLVSGTSVVIGGVCVLGATDQLTAA